MEDLAITYSDSPDRTLSAALSPIGSLVCSREYCGDLIQALRQNLGAETLDQCARKLVEQTVPEDGDGPTQRATYSVHDDSVMFTTPDGVTICVCADYVHFDFGRDAEQLASSIIASVAMADGRPFRARFLSASPREAATNDRVVKVFVKDGMVQDVEYPEDLEVVVYDYDTEGADEEKLGADHAGYRCFVIRFLGWLWAVSLCFR